MYFGPDASYALCPHNADNLNLAIQIDPISRTAIGDINIYVYLSNVNNVQVTNVTINLYCGLASDQPPNDWTKNGFLTKWDTGTTGLRPVPETPNAKVLNCCWMGNYLWHTNAFPKIHGRNFGLLATLDCNDTSQHPAYSVISEDPCAAVFNSMLL